MPSANHIVRFFKNLLFSKKYFLEKKSVDANSEKLKVDRVFLVGHNQKWVWPTCSWDSRIDYVSRMNRWNKLIFCRLVKIHMN